MSLSDSGLSLRRQATKGHAKTAPHSHGNQTRQGGKRGHNATIYNSWSGCQAVCSRHHYAMDSLRNSMLSSSMAQDWAKPFRDRVMHALGFVARIEREWRLGF